jgi:hypothetical protein
MHKLGVWWSWFMSWSGDDGSDGKDLGELQTIYTSNNVVNFGGLNAPDADEDGLTSVQEAALGSSDATKDSNTDGVNDGAAWQLGWSPMEEINEFIAFLENERKLVRINRADESLLYETAVWLDTTTDTPGTVTYFLKTSPDLENGTRVPVSKDQYLSLDPGNTGLGFIGEEGRWFLRLGSAPVQP